MSISKESAGSAKRVNKSANIIRNSNYNISIIVFPYYRNVYLPVLLCSPRALLQNTNTDEDSKPVILYSGTPKKYEIADIKVEGDEEL